MAMGIGAQALASLTGKIESACLIIHDYRGQAAKDAANHPNFNMEDELFSFASSRQQNTQKALAGDMPDPYPSSDSRLLKVQFNPSTLTLNASAVPKEKKDSDTSNSRTMAVEDPKLSLTTTLFFDDMDTYDAFMWDKFTAGLSIQGISNIAKGVTEGLGKNRVHSVQSRVESLVAVLRNPYTRTITFRWADFSFIGQLNTVRVNYTMFSPSGRPIRAEVLLRIQHEMDPSMLHGWYDDFQKVFANESGKNIAVTSLVTPEQTSANLLNMVL